MIRTLSDQQYTQMRIAPHVTRDGRTVQLAIWRSNCADCGATFETATLEKGKRFEPARRCHLHRAPGRRVRRAGA